MRRNRPLSNIVRQNLKALAGEGQRFRASDLEERVAEVNRLFLPDQMNGRIVRRCYG